MAKHKHVFSAPKPNHLVSPCFGLTYDTAWNSVYSSGHFQMLIADGVCPLRAFQ